jgi:8-oxo-dGTP pyrophosphatase MutT (NUDIX family)
VIDEASCEPYYRIAGANSVISCILDQDDCFVLVRQFRPNLEMYTLESPAGAIDKEESPLAAMRREIFEESGLRCPLLPVGSNFSLMMNRTNIKDYLFFGMFPEESQRFIADPDIEVLRLPRRELLKLALRGDYLQLATLGLLQLVGGVLCVDMWRDHYDLIETAFLHHPAVCFDSNLV